MPKQQKSWQTPQLIILARGTPEESVLLHCKRIGYGGETTFSQSSGQTGCDQAEGDKSCGNCQSRSGS